MTIKRKQKRVDICHFFEIITDKKISEVAAGNVETLAVFLKRKWPEYDIGTLQSIAHTVMVTRKPFGDKQRGLRWLPPVVDTAANPDGLAPNKAPSRGPLTNRAESADPAAEIAKTGVILLPEKLL